MLYVLLDAGFDTGTVVDSVPVLSLAGTMAVCSLGLLDWGEWEGDYRHRIEVGRVTLSPLIIHH